MSFVNICNYVKIVNTFERDKSVTLIEAFKNCYISSFSEGNLHSLLFITSSLGALPLVFDRWSCTYAIMKTRNNGSKCKEIKDQCFVLLKFSLAASQLKPLASFSADHFLGQFTFYKLFRAVGITGLPCWYGKIVTMATRELCNN